MRWLIYGNSGSGKSTLARRLAQQHGLATLDLDTIAWSAQLERAPLDESVGRLRDFATIHPSWVIEGCYGLLIEAATAWCSRLIFLNPGVETCLANCRRRPWEPHKFATPAEQDAMLDSLLDWVRTYPTRVDEFGLKTHQAIFDRFTGPKVQINRLSELDQLF